MYKKPLALLLALVMVLAMFPAVSLAAKGDVHQVTSWPNGKAQLIGGEPQWVFFKQGNPPSNGIAAIWTPQELGDTEKAAYLAEVKTKDPSISGITLSGVSFFTGSQIITNGNNNTGKYRVGQENGVWYVYVDVDKLSHFYYKEGESLGRVTVNASVVENFRIITLQDQYKYDVQDFYLYNVQDFYKYNVQDFYKCDVQDFYGRTAQNIYIPMFAKKAVKAGSDTLVAWRDNKTIPGGTFNNGMTYLEIDAATARETGYIFGIADSSPSNRYVGYNFNVRIEGNELVISFDSRFISAGVSAKVYSTAPAKHDPSGHKTMRTGDELRLPLPAPAASAKAPAASVTAVKNGNNVTLTITDGASIFTSVVQYEKNAAKSYSFNGYTVAVSYNGSGVKSAAITAQPPAAPVVEPAAQKYYLFFHLENGVNFYETFDYQFAGWKLDEIKYSDYEKVDTTEGNPYWVRTETSAPYFVETETGDPYLDHTDTGENYLVAKDVEIGNIPSTRPYTGAVTLTVDGVPQTLGTEFTLAPGAHTFVLGFADRTVTEIWTVNAGDVHSFTFATQYVDGLNETNRAADLVTENKLEDAVTANRLDDVTTENRLDDVTTENRLADVYNPDTWLDDLYRGSIDPEDSESILYGIYTPARP
ncbi:MAG: hypothetical protein LLF87_03315 [Eubacteriales bacterium]|nr:hypothetical protein [Eubacteriales bacterium]